MNDPTPVADVSDVGGTADVTGQDCRPVSRMSRGRLVRTAVLALVPAVAVAAVVLRAGSGRSSTEDPAIVGGPASAGVTIWPPDRRVPAPELSGTGVDERPVNLADRRGYPVVLNAWGSWCPPCRAEAPDLARAANNPTMAGVRFLGLNERDDRAAAAAFTRRFGLPYPSFFDPDGRLLLLFRGIVPTSAIPTTLILDTDGRIAARVIGRITYATLTGLLSDLGRPSPSPARSS